MREYKGKSIIALPGNYVVIDVETTGLSFEYSEIIEIAAIKYFEGQITEKFTSLVQPTPFTSLNEDDEWEDHYVDSFISELTGITDEMLAAAPKPSEVLPKLMAFIGDNVLLGHNVGFDVNFLYDAASRIGERLSNDYIDTMRIARKVFPQMAHHRLRDVAAACEVKQDNAHRAEQDCLVTARIYEIMRERILREDTEETFKHRFRRCYHKRSEKLLSIRPTVSYIDDTNPIYGKVVVFTGALSSMLRQDAFQIVANLGGVPEDRITKRTNYLVIGDTDFAKSVKNGKTTKMRTAEDYIKKDRDILIVSEKSFFDLISEYMYDDSIDNEQSCCFVEKEIAHDEKWVIEELKALLEETIKQNNADIAKLFVKEGKSYTSVFYDSQLAFRIYCRGQQCYFSVANVYAGCAGSEVVADKLDLGKNEQFTNFRFSATKDGVAKFGDFLSKVLDCVIDTIPKQFDCCSRYEECSNAKRCIHPKPETALACGYRKIMKKGRIYYGKNRNI